MIQVINRALDLLEQIAEEPDKPKALGELADGLGLNHGTCANILKTLVTRGYIEQTGTKKGYILGSKSYNLTGNEGYKKELLEAAKPLMDLLTSQINENCLLAVLKDNQRVALYRTFSEQDLQVRTPDEKLVYDSASGRLLLAMLPVEKQKRFISRFGLPQHGTWPEVTSEAALFTQLQLIKREEFAIQTIPNRQVIGLAVPIYQKGLVIASLSIYLPAYRYMAADSQQMRTLLREVADKLNKKLI